MSDPPAAGLPCAAAAGVEGQGSAGQGGGGGWASSHPGQWPRLPASVLLTGLLVKRRETALWEPLWAQRAGLAGVRAKPVPSPLLGQNYRLPLFPTPNPPRKLWNGPQAPASPQSPALQGVLDRQGGPEPSPLMSRPSSQEPTLSLAILPSSAALGVAFGRWLRWWRQV